MESFALHHLGINNLNSANDKKSWCETSLLDGLVISAEHVHDYTLD